MRWKTVNIYAQKLKDGLLDALDEVEIQQIKFHPTSCDGTYTLGGIQFKEPVPVPENDVETVEVITDIMPGRPLMISLISLPPPQTLHKKEQCVPL